jgi:hypothetical protein
MTSVMYSDGSPCTTEEPEGISLAIANKTTSNHIRITMEATKLGARTFANPSGGASEGVWFRNRRRGEERTEGNG